MNKDSLYPHDSIIPAFCLYLQEEAAEAEDEDLPVGRTINTTI
jgi:hypothetical protein